MAVSILDESYKKSPINIDALIAYPKKGEGPFPLVVFSHASGGPGQFSSKWFKFNKLMAMQLRKKGFAIMFLDNFSARGAINTYEDQSQVPNYAGYVDAFMALEYLSKDPKINIKKVGPVAAFKTAIVIKRLPKTRSGKILRGTVRKIADNETYKMPATIDDPAILGEIKEDLKKHQILK